MSTQSQFVLENSFSPLSTWHGQNVPLRGPLMAGVFDVDMIGTDPWPQHDQNPLRGPSRADWDSHRQTITRLYSDQNKTLRDVMSHMKKYHGLVATEKMYKARIKKWGLDKKLKRHEVIAMLVLMNHHRGADASPIFTVRGKDINQSDLERYTRRAHISSSELYRLQPEDACKAAPDLVYNLRPNTPKHVKPPDQLYRFESLSHVMTSYIAAAFDAAFGWVGKNGRICWIVKDSGYSYYEIFSLYETSITRYKEGKMREAGLLWRRASRRSESLINSLDPIQWLQHLPLRYYLSRNLPLDIYNSLDKQMITLINVRLGTSSPHRSLARSICLLPDSDLEPAINICYTNLLRTWQSKLPPHALLLVRFELTTSLGLELVGLISDDLYHMSVDEYSSVESDQDRLERVFELQHCRAWNFLLNGDDGKARDIAKTMAKASVVLSDQEDRDFYMLAGVYTEAISNFRMNNYEVAKAKYEDFFEGSLRYRKSYGEDFISVAELHTCYEDMHYISNLSEIADGDQQWLAKMNAIEKAWEDELSAEVGHLSLESSD